MKFIIDAQLPKKLSAFLNLKGFDSIHTFELPMKNRTSDNEIIEICSQEKRILVTKDSDFYDSKIIRNKPEKLILVHTGNLENELLLKIFNEKLDKIILLINSYGLVEIDQYSIKAK